MLGDGTASTAAQERIARHQHAAEVLRARSVLGIAFSLWLLIGLSLDLAMYGPLGHGSLAFVVIVRVCSSAYHFFVLAMLFRRPLPSPRAANALIASIFPVTVVALMLMASEIGGLSSPYITAGFVGLMVMALAFPGPWQKRAPVVVVTVLVYPIGLLAMSQIDPVIGAQLHDMRAIAIFIVYVSVWAAAGVVVVWGGHVIWSLRQSVFESRNIGRYRLARRIGKGGMGEVWRATDRALGREVALKILSPEHGRNPDAIARFEREIHATSEVAHPNVVRIHDWGITDDGVWYYAMDLLEGVDLATVVRQCGPLPPALVIHLGMGVAGGLAEAHRRGVLHRDIKPGNLFVISPGGEAQRIELLDFGIARIGTGADITEAGAIMGTPPFMAPEVLAGATAGVPADVYGLAASLYFALTGKSPRDTNGAPPSEIAKSVPAALDDLIVRALDRDPSRRPATATELEDALVAMGSAWSGKWRVDATIVDPEPDADPATDADAPPTVAEPIRSRAPAD